VEPDPVAVNSENLSEIDEQYEGAMREAEKEDAEYDGVEPEQENTDDAIVDEDDAEPSEPSPFIARADSSQDCIVIADSYFGSLHCARKLNEMGVYCLLAARKNIDSSIKGRLWQGLKKKKWRNIFSADENLTYCCFNDRSCCSFVSNFASGALLFHVHRNQKWTYRVVPLGEWEENESI